MFSLKEKEWKILRSQIVTSRLAGSKSGWGGTRYRPNVFTEQGVAMFSSILKNETAIKVNIRIRGCGSTLLASLFLIPLKKHFLHMLVKYNKAFCNPDEPVVKQDAIVPVCTVLFFCAGAGEEEIEFVPNGAAPFQGSIVFQEQGQICGGHTEFFFLFKAEGEAHRSGVDVGFGTHAD